MTIFKSPALLLFTFFVLLVSSCDGNKFQEVKIDGFEGTWEVKGRKMFEGITIQIKKNEHGEFQGEVVSINDNKYVKMFSEPGDQWVSAIKRVSNYEFKLTEKKIGSALFSVYGLDSSKDFRVQFIDENTIGLSTGGADPQSSLVRYVRVGDHK